MPKAEPLATNKQEPNRGFGMIAAHQERTPSNNPGKPAGLRERQKRDRFNRILEAASEQFSELGFEGTTIASIAGKAGVSTPTVFNYFRSKDELLLALVVRVHEQTRERIRLRAREADLDPAHEISRFLFLYSEISLQSLSRSIWRHVEATRIRIPESAFVQHYDILVGEMLEDFQEFLREESPLRDSRFKQALGVAGKILFMHWSGLFIELIRDESISLERHRATLNAEIGELVARVFFSPSAPGTPG